MARTGHRRSIAMNQVGLTSGMCFALASVCPAIAAPIDPADPASVGQSQSACADSDAECVTLLGVTIDGAQAFSAAELAGAYEDFLAQRVGLQELALIASRITKRYLDEGYFLSQAIVPPQELAGGVARILVIEGRVSEVEVRGDGAVQVAPYVSGLPSQTIANLKDIDRRLALASDVPGVTLRSSVEAIPDDPARHRLVVTTEFQPTQGQMYIDNRGSDAAGPIQVYGQFSVNSIFSARDQVRLSAYTTPEDPSELTQLGGSYRYLFGGKSEIGVSALQSKAQDGYDIDSPNIGADSQVVALWYSRALSRSRAKSIWIDASLEGGHYESEWQTGGGYEDELRVGRIMLRGRLNEAGHSTNILMRISAGIDALGASGSSNTRRSRYDADGSFTKFDFEFSHYRDLGRYFGLYAALSGQASPDPLLLSEEFAAGGSHFGRAYSYGEITGDQAIGALVELRAGFDPGLDPISFIQGYAFYDAAQTWNYNTPAGAKDLSLSSAGLGLRVDFLDWLTARVETAKPLSRAPFETGDKDWRQFFSLSASY